jgi:hypothetical protein
MLKTSMACAGPSCQLALMVFRASMTAALTTLLACPYRKTRMRERLALGRLLKLPAGAGTVPCDYDRDAHRPTGHAPGDRSVASRSPGRCARAPAPTRRAPASGAAPPPAPLFRMELRREFVATRLNRVVWAEGSSSAFALRASARFRRQPCLRTGRNRRDWLLRLDSNQQPSG